MLHRGGNLATEWLAPLGLKQTFGFTQGDFAINEVPAWAGFLIWAGWWMRRAQVPDTRIFMVVLLPNRGFAASLVALGAMIGSLGRTGRTLSWDQFLELPVGDRVFLRMEHRKTRYGSMSVEGRVGSFDREGDSVRRQIALVSDQTRLQGATLSVAPKRFFEYDVALGKHHSPRKARRLGGISRFFSGISDDFEDSWISALSSESVIVTNRAGWARQTADLNITIAGKTGEAAAEVGITELLMCGAPDTAAGVRTVLVSPKTAFPESKVTPVGVLDGVEALKSWELVQTSNQIILLEQCEYDEAARDEITRLAGIRDDGKLPVPRDMPAEVPGGMDMMMFAFAAGEAS